MYTPYLAIRKGFVNLSDRKENVYHFAPGEVIHTLEYHDGIPLEFDTETMTTIRPSFHPSRDTLDGYVAGGYLSP